MKALKDLTREEIIAEHRKMGNWIADYYKSFDEDDDKLLDIISLKRLYITKERSSYAEELWIIPHNGCFACYWANKERMTSHNPLSMCNLYPFRVKNIHRDSCMNGLYNSLCGWIYQIHLGMVPFNQETRDEIYNICKEIAEMKEREE